MKYEIVFYYTQTYLPSKRHRKTRERSVEGHMNIEVPELTVAEFPVAFIVKAWASVYENAYSYNDFNGNGDFRIFTEEIRTYRGQLYAPVRVTSGAAVSMIFEPLSYIQEKLTGRNPWANYSDEFTERSIITGSDEEYVKNKIIKEASEFIIFDDKVWKLCGEPMYEVRTFGLGHNHGGTGMFIAEHYNPNVPNRSYFNALEKAKAVAYANQVAEGRGDTNDIGKFGKDIDIEVLMPELVRRDPMREHGEGDPFMHALEGLIQQSDSSVETGLFVMAHALKEVMR